MKTRSGFVSNSSTTSFICSVCEEAGESGDYDQALCCDKCGEWFHTGCWQETRPKRTPEERFESLKSKMVEAGYSSEDVKNFISQYNKSTTVHHKGDILEKQEWQFSMDDGKLIDCPICNHKLVSIKNMKTFLLEKCGLTPESAIVKYYEEHK